MNRSVRAFLATIMIGLLLVPVVSTAGWHSKEVGWHVTHVSGDGSSILQVDTLKTVLNGVNTFDTTAVFTLDMADRSMATGPAPVGTSSVLDSTASAFLVFQTDSAAVPVNTNGTFTLYTEGRQGGYGLSTSNARGWCRVDSTVITLGAAYDESFSFPIKTWGTYKSPWSYTQLRVRSAGGTGIMTACRVFLRWWNNDSANEHRP